MLRVSLGSSLAVREVIPRLPPFLDMHPALKVQLMPEDRLHDLVAEGIDGRTQVWQAPGLNGDIPHHPCIARRVLAASPS